ncbi:tol-pal system protein YbgF [Ideonella sp. BN130291]|uniref:tol-pal system protein YbgF n=1 Tax=Ideonella sp. BN130291 TaxID=3112940 RepID=UPI002E258C8F|nr:tol-pal system protein YbgF [Ideonella sp. BN130291]
MRFARHPRAAAAALLLGAALQAQAGILEDDEARKAILELRNRVSQMEARQAEQASQQREELQQLRRNLLDANNQIEALRAELARMRGQDEQLARDVAELQRHQKDIAQGVEERIRKLEPQKVVVDGKEFMADAEEKRLYDEAVAPLRSGDFAGSAAALVNFMKRFPNSGFIDSARFWLGNAQYGKREYREAIASFRAFVSAAPQHPRAPEGLLAIANCQIEMKDNKSAKRTLEELVRVYPQSEAAQAAKERLVSLK